MSMLLPLLPNSTVPVPPSVSRVVEVHLPVCRTGRIAQAHRGVVQRQAIHNVHVGVVVARQVQVPVGRHPVQRPA